MIMNAKVLEVTNIVSDIQVFFLRRRKEVDEEIRSAFIENTIKKYNNKAPVVPSFLCAKLLELLSREPRNFLKPLPINKRTHHITLAERFSSPGDVMPFTISSATFDSNAENALAFIWQFCTADNSLAASGGRVDLQRTVFVHSDNEVTVASVSNLVSRNHRPRRFFTRYK